MEKKSAEREEMYQEIIKTKPEFKEYLKRNRPTMEEVAELIIKMKKEGNPKWRPLLHISRCGTFETRINTIDRFNMPQTYKCLDEHENVLRRNYVGHTGFDEISFDFDNDTWSILEVGVAM